MSLILSMAAFALATSITPGPVNVVALSSGARFGFVASQKHVFGAATGFTLLLVLIGLGLHEVLLRWPILTQLIQWGGVAFLLYMAWKLAVDDGRLDAEGTATAPSMLYGAIMQWLNPKAWLACVAGMGMGMFLQYQVAPYLADQRLQILLEAFESPPRPLSLVLPHARLLPTRTRVFIDWMREALQGFRQS